MTYGGRTMATTRMNESWRRMKAQIETIWEGTEFDDNEMKRARGSLQKMINLIHQKTGESRSEIMNKMSAIL
jgi:hypothetical protein